MLSETYPRYFAAALLAAITALPAFADMEAAKAGTGNQATMQAISDADKQALHNLGWFEAQQFDAFEFTEAEKAALREGFIKGLAGKGGPDDEAAASMQLRNFMQQRMEIIRTQKAAMQIEKNEAFVKELEANAAIQKSESGLYYEIIESGDDQRATRADQVKVHYTGTLIDGTVFDSSVERGQPATFPVSGVVPGFAEGVQLVGKGGKVKLYIKPELGYGERGAGGAIPPNAFILFDVEMLEIIPAG